MTLAVRVLVFAWLMVTLSACVSVVAGTAVRPHSAGPGTPTPPDVPVMRESDLDRVLLSVGDLNGILGATKLGVDDQSAFMSDHSDDVSDPQCLGAVYGAEEKVYADTGWTALRDEVVQEPGDGNDHWVEQIAVLYPSAARAGKFFATSRDQWQSCAGTSIETYGNDFTYWWEIDDLNAGDGALNQTIRQQDADGWGCQHAMALASNLIVETWACSFGITDEAQTIASEMLANAASR